MCGMEFDPVESGFVEDLRGFDEAGDDRLDLFCR